ncbi:MAG TPA: DUF1343 domain-containing protein [Elusimicrobiota bacterium]|nr:DUF1343 domain-containing protein [Elusimicrobiota bacterium]
MRRTAASVLTGLDVLGENDFAELRGARVGLLHHQASVDRHLRPIVRLMEKSGVRVAALFAPEHGLWGSAQDQVPIDDVSIGSRHSRPIFSLYGDHRVPTEEQLNGLDVLVCDLQDVGSRYYTFIWTMALAMQACARFAKEFWVLDRPNPINGIQLEGPVLDLNFASFVGLYAMPARHGMTIGEVAMWLNAEFDIGARLKVVPMRGWKRRMYFEETGLPWVLPSPNMPTVDTAVVYPGGCLIEGTNLSEGRGTTHPFELLGAPFIDPQALAARLERRRFPGANFRACRFEPTFHKFQGELCGGLQIHVTDRKAFKSFLSMLVIIQEIRNLYPSKFAWRSPPYEYEREKWPFDILCGTDRVRLDMERGRTVEALEPDWRNACRAFDRRRARFLLYN